MKKILLVPIVLIFLAGCQSQKKLATTDPSIRQPINVELIATADSVQQELEPLKQLVERSETIYITFPYNSVAFSEALGRKATLDALSQNASRIIIRGRTDAWKPTQSNTNVARARAVSARDYLIERGASSSNIQINYLPAGDHVADNRTERGKSLNRRVEIEFITLDLQNIE